MVINHLLYGMILQVCQWQNEGLGWDPLKKYNHPGGDWHPGQGDNPIYNI